MAWFLPPAVFVARWPRRPLPWDRSSKWSIEARTCAENSARSAEFQNLYSQSPSNFYKKIKNKNFRSSVPMYFGFFAYHIVTLLVGDLNFGKIHDVLRPETAIIGRLVVGVGGVRGLRLGLSCWLPAAFSVFIAVLADLPKVHGDAVHFGGIQAANLQPHDGK